MESLLHTLAGCTITPAHLLSAIGWIHHHSSSSALSKDHDHALCRHMPAEWVCLQRRSHTTLRHKDRSSGLAKPSSHSASS